MYIKYIEDSSITGAPRVTPGCPLSFSFTLDKADARNPIKITYNKANHLNPYVNLLILLLYIQN